MIYRRSLFPVFRENQLEKRPGGGVNPFGLGQRMATKDMADAMLSTVSVGAKQYVWDHAVHLTVVLLQLGHEMRLANIQAARVASNER